MTLPDFFAKEGAPDVLKVDIEGGELRLDVEALSRARLVFLEVHVAAFSAIERLEGNANNYNVRIG